ncbi:MAG: 3-deoxy-8-phosphooctulonate synthase [Desulfobacca sp.]|uniref:3-deoxy-8-phosphooctulonate synthase n=1 Tax=Desulfobacca sp. TaxID=2067990 RepID=UPI0040497D0F
MAEQGVNIANFVVGTGRLVFIAGPCVIESRRLTLETAQALKEYATRLGAPLIFKASFDKANRTASTSFRGPGLAAGLEILAQVKSEVGLPVLSDVHEVQQVNPAAQVLDVIQIPAFLCRQTDLIEAAAKTGKPLNIKKGQFLAPWDMAQAAAKATAMGNTKLLLTERGTMFGYNNLVVDFRSLAIMRSLGFPVVMDITHAVQLPGGQGSCSGGDRRFIPALGRAAVAVGVDAVFMEVHPDPDKALCDGPNSVPLAQVPRFWQNLLELHACCRRLEEVGC